MDIGVLIAFVAWALVLALAIRANGSKVQTVGPMVNTPDLGWPHGVQEDDDMCWTWAAASANDAPRPRRDPRSLPDPEPEIVDLEPASLHLPRVPLRGHMH